MNDILISAGAIGIGLLALLACLIISWRLERPEGQTS